MTRDQLIETMSRALAHSEWPLATEDERQKWARMNWQRFTRQATAALSTLEAAGMRVDAVGKRVRHVKRGSTYEIVGVAAAQVSGGPRPLTDYEILVVYRGEDGQLWCRFEDEFNDGRFEALCAQEDSTSD